MNVKASIVFDKNWKALNSGYRVILNEGSSRSSKTWSFFLLIYLYAKTNARKRILVLRDTKVACRDIVESEFRDWLEDPNARLKEAEKGLITISEAYALIEKEELLTSLDVNLTKARYKFPNGSTIIFTGADNKKQIIGKENDLVWVNEPYEFPQEIMKQLIKRVTKSLLIDWNPSEDLYIENYKSREDCKVIHSTFRDNPFLNKNVKKEILGTKPLLNKHFDFQVEHYKTWSKEDVLTDLQKKQINEDIIKEVLMCWNNEKEKSADSFHWDVYGEGIKAERPNRIYRFKEISYAEYMALDTEIYYGVDWGQVHPFGILEIKYYDGALYCHELNYKSENKLKSELSEHERQQININHPEGFIMWFFRKLNIKQDKTIVCDNNRPQKVIALRSAGFEYSKTCRKFAGSVVDGISILSNMDIYYTRTSVNLKSEQEKYQRKTDRMGNVLEEPEDKDNHLLDPLSYVARDLKDQGIIRTI